MSKPRLTIRSWSHRWSHRWARDTAALVIAFASLSACSNSGTGGALSPAPSATSPNCRRALDAAPLAVLDQPRGNTSAPGTLVWGTRQIVVRCGLAEPAPTTDWCQNVDGIDWVVQGQARTDPIVFISYGRSPALEVRVPASYGSQNASGALVDVQAMAKALPTNGHNCS